MVHNIFHSIGHWKKGALPELPAGAGPGTVRAVRVPPRQERVSSGPTDAARYDRLDHWIVSTEADSKGVPKRRNCKQCANEGKKDNKTLLLCEKCSVPLHHHCFKGINFLPLIFENYFCRNFYFTGFLLFTFFFKLFLNQWHYLRNTT